MKILTRYLLRTHAGPFFFSLTVLTGLLFVNSVARRLEDLAGKGLDASVILEVLWLSLPHIIALTLPMAVLVAVLFAFSQLTADNEITALKASGTNLLSLLAPLLVAAVLLAAGMVWFNDRVLPESNHLLKNLLMDVGRKSPTFQLKEQVINPIRPGSDLRAKYYLQAANIDPATNRLRDVVIYDLSMGQKARTVYADSGYMAFNAAHTDLQLRLFDGWVHELDNYDADRFQRVHFGEYKLIMEGVGDEFERAQDAYRSDREMSLAMLDGAADSLRAEMDSLRSEAAHQSRLAVRRALAGPHTLPDDPMQHLPPSAGYGSFPNAYTPGSRPIPNSDDVAFRAAMELRSLQTEIRTKQELIDQFSVEWHKKFAIPFACIVFVLVGAPLAVRFPRGGVGMVIAISLTIFGIYYMSLIGGEALGDKGIIAPFWGPWGPNLVFLALALFGLARIGRETSTTRGGGWDDLWLTVRGFIARPWRRVRQLREREA